jgi:hypothetical protein
LPLEMELLLPKNNLPSRKGFHLRASWNIALRSFLSWSCSAGCWGRCSEWEPVLQPCAPVNSTQLLSFPSHKLLDHYNIHMPS